METPAAFPNEVFELILSFIGNSPSALQRLKRVSRDFLRSCNKVYKGPGGYAVRRNDFSLSAKVKDLFDLSRFGVENIVSLTLSTNAPQLHAVPINMNFIFVSCTHLVLDVGFARLFVGTGFDGNLLETSFPNLSHLRIPNAMLFRRHFRTNIQTLELDCASERHYADPFHATNSWCEHFEVLQQNKITRLVVGDFKCESLGFIGWFTQSIIDAGKKDTVFTNLFIGDMDKYSSHFRYFQPESYLIGFFMSKGKKSHSRHVRIRINTQYKHGSQWRKVRGGYIVCDGMICYLE